MRGTQTDKSTLVLGSTGKTGRRVAKRLRERGVLVREGSRHGRPPFDWEDAGTWAPALESVENVYVSYYPDLAFAGAAEAVRRFADSAVEAGVRRLVLLSGRGEEGALLAEQAIRESGAEWTIVQASWFSQNFSEGHLLEPVLRGEVAFPAAQVSEPFVDAEDIADVATAALIDDRHAGQIYEVTGPRLLTFGEAIAMIAQAAGREITYTPVTAKDYAATLVGWGLPGGYVTELIQLFTTVLDGRNARLGDGVQRALGQSPRGFADYVRLAAASGVWMPGAGPSAAVV